MIVLLPILIVVLVGALLLSLFVVGIYNGLIALRNRFKNAFSQIDIQLKRRYDLIPNLVETCKGYMKHESGTLEAVVAARNSAATAASRVATNPADPTAMKQLLQAEGQLSAGLGRLLAVAEAYPDLKANTNMMALQEELTSTENRISFARQAFNDAATEYNIKREVFPSNLIANTFNFTVAELWIVEDPTERQSVKVSF
ncbi:MAG: LemA family protein [Pedosphaera sp.]|nr:LemA family protein [Pedosphaera sp.]